MNYQTLYTDLITEVRAMREAQVKNERSATMDNKRRKLATEAKVDRLIGSSAKPAQNPLFR